MYNKQTKEVKKAIVQRYTNGKSVSALAKETQIARSTIYSWIREAKLSTTKKIQIKDFFRLRMQYERSQRVIQILQTAPCTASAPQAGL